MAGLAQNQSTGTAKKALSKAAALRAKSKIKKVVKKPTPSLLLKAPKAAPATPMAVSGSAPSKDPTPAKAVTPKKVLTQTPKAKPSAGDIGLEFIGRFPMRKGNADKKLDNKKSSVGPVFDAGDYKVATFNTPLCQTYYEEFKSTYLGRHNTDSADVDYVQYPSNGMDPNAVAIQSFHKIIEGTLDMFLLNMKDIPLELPKGLTIGAAFKREDPRDVLVTRSTYGAIQELPHQAKIAANSKRRVMQIRALRPDLQIVPSLGNVNQRLELIDSSAVDALVLSWSSLRRLNLSPRYYVSLQAEVMVPAPCQGSVGVVCRESDASLLAKLHYVEDSEASWSSRCERAFVSKMGGKPGAPIGALAHRKGTQDPWILDIAVGDPSTGEILKHREIGTSRCKPESLADKAFAGILGKGARRFMFL